MKILPVLPTLLFAFALVSCTRSNPKVEATKTLHFSFGDDVKGADPATMNDQVSAELMGHIFDGLLGFKYLGKMDEVEPVLAESLPTFSDKDKTVTFKIKPGIKFQDDAAFPNGKGREVVAEDFVYSLKRLGDPSVQSPNWWMFDGVVVGFNEWRQAIEKAKADQRKALFEKPIEGLSAPDAHTFVIKLKRPYPQLLQILAMTSCVAVAHEVVEKYGPEIISHPVGTGAFRLKTWVRGSKIIVEKNPTYRQDLYPSTGSDEDKKAGLLAAAGKPMPFVDTIEWDIIKEEQPRWLKFRRGELDAAGIPKDNFGEAIGADGQLKPELVNEGILLSKAPSLTAWWIEFNLKDPVLGKNLKLRQALSFAIDRARALQLLYNDRGVLASSPIPPSIEGGDNGSKGPYDYNVEKAKALLAEAGFKDGKGLPALTFDLRGPGVTQRQLGELLRDNFEKVGVKLNILANSFPEALEKAKTARFQIMLGGWAADYPDAENFLQLFYGPNEAPGTNSSNFHNKEFDTLYEQIRMQRPSPERSKAVARMVEILQAEAPMAPFFHAVDYRLVKKWLKNYKPQLLLYGTGKYLDLDQETKVKLLAR